jgi:hypothetical protein
MIHGFCDKFFKCAYQANVMKTFEATSKQTVLASGDILALLFAIPWQFSPP